jgi:hypothetical protein
MGKDFNAGDAINEIEARAAIQYMKEAVEFHAHFPDFIENLSSKSKDTQNLPERSLDIVRCAETILAGVIPYYLILFPKSQREKILDEVLKDVKDYVKEKKDIL